MIDIFGELTILASSGYLIFLVSLCLVGTVREIKITRIQRDIIIVLMIISYASLAFFIIGRDGWDLNVYYSVIKKMRTDGFNAVRSSDGIDFFDLPFVKILFFLVSKLPYDNFLQVIAIVIDYSFLVLGMHAILGAKETSFRSISYFLLIHFAMSSFAYTISGIRNTMAFSIISLAVIRDLYCKKHGLLTMLLYLIPIGIHPSVVIVILIRSLFFVFSKRSILHTIFLIWGFGLGGAIKLAKPLEKIPFFEMILKKAEYYLDLGAKNLFSNFKYEIFRLIVILILILIIRRIFQAVEVNKQEEKMLEFIRLTCLITIGALPVYVIYDRMCVFIGWIAFLPTTLYVSKTRPWVIKREWLFLLPFVILLILMNLRHLFVFAQLVMPWN